MSIFGPANTVTAADIALLEDSVQFFQSSASNQSAVAGAIQAGNTTVAAYAAQLLNANLSFSQVAMGVSCIELGIAQTTTELDNWSTGFLPAQVTNAINHGFNPTVYAAEALGLALAGEPEFAAFTGLNATQFSISVSTLTGVNQSVIQTWVTNWTHFYTPVAQGGLGGSTFGLSVTAAAYGAALGDAVGVALLNPTSAGLQTVISTNAQGETVIEGDVANHLLDIATGQYTPGIDCDLLPDHAGTGPNERTPLQGEGGSSAGGLRLTINVDNLTATTAGAIFDASPASNPPLGQDNTLNSGDNLQDPFGDGTLNFATAQNSFFGSINPPFAQNVTMNGISDANILSQDFNGNFAGFAGAILGLLNVTLLAGSTAGAQVGDTNVGLLTPLQNITINASQDFEAHIASVAFAGGEAVNLNLNGVDTTVDLDVESGTNFYAQVDIHSLTAENFLTLNTNADTIATITADGDQDLSLFGEEGSFGSALDVANLHTFDGSALTGDLTVDEFFGTGDLTASGGSGNDDLGFDTDGAVTVSGNDGNDTFTFENEVIGGTGPSFTAADSADGGAGDNLLRIEAQAGALLLGGNIANIQTIEHFGEASGDISVDMSLSGSATILDLQGDYGYVPGTPPFVVPALAGNDVSVSELTNADNVVYTGDLTPDEGSNGINNLTLSHALGVGTVNFTMDQTLDGGTMTVGEIHIPTATTLLHLDSIGNADLNWITDASDITGNVQITGDVDLNFVDPNDFNFKAYDQDNGIIDASTFTGNLQTSVGDGSQQVFAGTGDDFIETFSNVGPDVIHLEAGGSDRVQFENPFNGDNVDLGGATALTEAHRITGFDVADDTVEIDVSNVGWDLVNTLGGPVTNPVDIAVFQTNQITNTGLFFPYDMVKLTSPVNTANLDAEEGFQVGVGVGGSFDTNNIGGDDLLWAYFDATHQQMVLGFVNGVGGDVTSADDFDVIALIGMNQTQYDAFGASNITFVND